MKYAPRKVYIKENNVYVELSYTDFCHRRQADQSYMDKLFIPVQGCLLEVVREQYADFYKDKERWRYLKKLDTNHKLLSLEGFTDSEGNMLDFVIDETVDAAAGYDRLPDCKAECGQDFKNRASGTGADTERYADTIKGRLRGISYSASAYHPEPFRNIHR